MKNKILDLPETRKLSIVPLPLNFGYAIYDDKGDFRMKDGTWQPFVRLDWVSTYPDKKSATEVKERFEKQLNEPNPLENVNPHAYVAAALEYPYNLEEGGFADTRNKKDLIDAKRAIFIKGYEAALLPLQNAAKPVKKRNTKSAKPIITADAFSKMCDIIEKI